ncbi:hypothetical protein [Methanocalculus sp. MC3]
MLLPPVPVPPAKLGRPGLVDLVDIVLLPPVPVPPAKLGRPGLVDLVDIVLLPPVPLPPLDMIKTSSAVRIVSVSS